MVWLRRLTSGLGIAFLAGSLAAQELPFTHFTTENPRVPLPSASVQSLLQDAQGTIWMGFFSSGLGRYDGHEIELYGMREGLADRTVRRIVQDGQGYLWVGSETGLVVSDRPLGEIPPGGRPRFLQRVGDVELLHGRIRNNWLVAGRDGEVWVATAGQGLLRYRFEARGRLVESRFLLADRPQPPIASSVLAFRDGRVWMGLDDGDVAELVPGARELRLLPEEAQPPGPVRTLHEGASGILWGGTSTGVVWKREKGAARYEIVDASLTEGVISLWESTQGEFWAVSLGSGALRYRIDDGGIQRIGGRQGLPSRTQWQVIEDHEGNLWFAHNAGLSRLRSNYRAFTHLTGQGRAGEPALLPEPTVFAVLPPGGGDTHTWIGTGGGLALLGEDASIETIDYEDGLVSNSIYSLTRDSEGRVWVGGPSGINVISFDAPLPELADAQLRHRFALGKETLALLGRRSKTVYAIEEVFLPRSATESRPVSTLWISGIEGLRVGVEGRWLSLGTNAGLPGSGTTDVALAADGRIWVGTKDSGVLRSRDAPDAESLMRGPDPDGSPLQFERLGEGPRSLLSESILNLQASDDLVWIGTPDGLFALDARTAEPKVRLDSTRGLGGDQVMGMALDESRRRLWVTQNAGIVAVDLDTRLPDLLVSNQDGLVDNETWVAYSLAVDDAGHVYHGTPKGMSVYRPELDHRASQPPAPLLRKFDLRQDALGHNEVVLGYAALSFANERKVSYRTRLVGYDAAWSDETGDHRIRYTNLPALFFDRTYVFEVLASNGEGRWSDPPLRHEFVIRPAWFLSWWASVVYVLVLGLSIWGFNALRTRTLQERNRVLAELVAERTSILQSHAEELETLDQIVQTINREIEPRQVMQLLLEQGVVLVGQTRKGVFSILDRERGRFEILASTGWDRSLLQGIVLTIEEAVRRYSVETVKLAEGVLVVPRPGLRPGAEKLQHLPPAGSLLAIEVTRAERVEGYLVFDLETERPVFDRFAVDKLRRYRQHAISALEKARTVMELRRKTREAEQASRAKSTFLANMSHELRTPLNSIIGFSKVLLERWQPDDDPRRKKFLANILASGEHLLQLINDILDLSKVEAGRVEVVREEVSVTEVVRGVRSIMLSVAEARGITIDVECSENVGRVVADVSKLKQILYNLVSNAVKFSHDEGRVLIHSRLVGAVDSPLGTESLLLEVRDWGVGIDATDLHRVFEQFQQLDSQASRRFAGTGLGLALVRTFVELQEGEVDVESSLGEGSTFRVWLPSGPAKADGGEAAEAKV